MNLKICTLTGADPNIMIGDLIERSAGRPWLEWGFLWSPSKQGAGRYPTAAWISSSLDALNECGISSAVHLCGDGVRGFLAGLPGEMKLAHKATRIQLNFALSRGGIDLRILEMRVNEINKPVITQHNPSNLAATKISAANHQLLFDASGGRGLLPTGWLAPVHGKFCGYAGGLGPDTLERELPRIALATMGAPFAIDMESSLRTEDDRFDLERIDRILEIVDQAVTG